MSHACAEHLLRNAHEIHEFSNELVILENTANHENAEFVASLKFIYL